MTRQSLRPTVLVVMLAFWVPTFAQTQPTQPFVFTTSHTGSNVYSTLPAAETAMRATSPNLAFVRESLTGKYIRRHYQDGTIAEVDHGWNNQAGRPVAPDEGTFWTPYASGPFSGSGWGLGYVTVAQAEQNLANAAQASCPPGTPPATVTPLSEWWDHNRGGAMGPLTWTARRLYRYHLDIEPQPPYFCGPQDFVVLVEWGRSQICPQSYSVHYTGPTGGAGYCFSGQLGQIIEWNTYHEEADKECVGNPCFPATASKIQTFVDYEGVGLRFVRTWRSRMPSSVQWGGAAAPSVGRLPRGWTHSYLRRVVVNGDTPIAYFSETGSLIPLQVPTGSGPYLAQDGSGLQVRWSGTNEWRVYFPDGTAEVHRRETAAGCASVSYLDSVIHAAGMTTTLEYDGACRDGNPDRIVGPFGHTLNLTYIPSGTPRVLEALVDPDGQFIDYVYSSQLDRLEAATYQDARTEDYLYESPHPGQGDFLTGIVDEEGIEYASFAYDAQGRATNTQRAGGFGAWAIAYGSGSAVATDANGVSSTYGFQSAIGNGRIVGAVTRGVFTRSKTNETSGQYRPLTRSDERGITTTYQYDAYHLESMTEAASTSEARTTSFEYLNETSGLLISETAPSTCGAAFTRNTAYLSGTQLVQQRSETGYSNQSGSCQQITRAVTFEYGASGSFTRNNGLVTAIRGPRVGVPDDVTVNYNECTTGGGCGRVLTMTNAAGLSWSFDAYNAHGQVAQITQPNGVEVTYGYDSRQRLRTVTETANGLPARTTTTDYYDNGLVQRVTDPTGAFIEYTYNDARLLTEIRDNANNRIEYGYDLAGNRTSETIRDPVGTITSSRTMDYDGFNHLDTVSLPNPAGGSDVWDYAFDPTGLLQSVTSPEGRTTAYDDYDALGRLRSFLNAAGQRTTYVHDTHDNVVSVTALTTPSYPAGVVTGYVYDDFGRLVRETSADRGVLTHSYDEADNPLLTVDARGLSTNYVRDALNRLREIRVEPQGGGAQETLSIDYDDTTADGRRGQIVSASAQNGSLAYAYVYDAFGRRTSEQLSYTGLNVAALTQYAYDAADRLEEIRHGTATQPNLWVTRTLRDTSGLITDIEDRRGTPVDIVGNVAHAPFGPYQAMTFGNARQIDRGLDQRYRVGDWTLSGLESQVLTWTPDDNLGEANRTGADVWAHDFIYTHDALNRALTATYDDTEQRWVDYDTSGNIAGTGYFNLSPHENIISETYSYTPQTNRLVQIQDHMNPWQPYKPVVADASGNMTSTAMLTRAFEYDSLSQLRRVHPAGVPSSTTARYDFNHLGERARKETYPSGSVTQETLFSYLPGGRLLGETIFSNNLLSEQRDYVWLGDTPVAMHVSKFDAAGVVTADQTYYLHTDHRDMLRRATNAAGATVWLYQDVSSLYGEGYVANYNGGPISPINLRFPGQYFDAETGLHYNYYRTYWPHAGRYVQHDPIGLAGGLNTYLYANGNPLRFVDALGLEEGSPSNVRKRNAIAAWALGQEGSTTFAYDAYFSPQYPADSNKCSAFTCAAAASADAATTATVPDGRGGTITRCPTAAELGRGTVPNWRLLGPGESPQPGDIMANPFSGARPGVTGHAAVMVPDGAGGTTTQGAHATRVGPPGADRAASPRYRRYIGD